MLVLIKCACKKGIRVGLNQMSVLEGGSCWSYSNERVRRGFVLVLIKWAC